MIKKRLKVIALGAVTMFLLPQGVISQTTPDNLIYEGRLLDTSGNPITATLNFRFSFWKDADFDSADTNNDGSINTSATEYGGWSEVQTVTPNSNGIVSVNMGDAVSLPDINFEQHRYIQVEVKLPTDLDTSYTLLDPTGDNGADALDRLAMGSVAYAKNAESVGNRNPGTQSGNLLILGPGGLIDSSRMGGDTNEDTFTINADQTDTDATLTFGNALLNETLRFSKALSRFEFSDDVHTEGVLSASGGLIIDGITVLNGSVTLNGVTYNFPSQDGTNGKVLKTDGSGNLTWEEDIDTDTTLSLTDLDARYVPQSGDTTLTGSLTLSNNAGITVSGQSSFSGNTVTEALAAGSLSVEGQSSFSGNTVTEELSADSLSVRGQISATSLTNCTVVESNAGGILSCGPAPASTPPAACDATYASRHWIDTDEGITYTCDTSNNRNTWLSSQDLVIYGETSGNCGINQDAVSDKDCRSAASWGMYLPRPITITGYGYSEDGNGCSSGDFDIEVWSTNSNSSIDTYTLEKSIARNLTGAVLNDTGLNIEVSGDQYVMWGLDNNCSNKIVDWDLGVFFRWRHE